MPVQLAPYSAVASTSTIIWTCSSPLLAQVRRQIYIIRTSGARLLALINDVMDAAALRQNKLVLKQEAVGGLWLCKKGKLVLVLP